MKDDLNDLLKREGKDLVKARNQNEETPLHMAASEGHIDIINILLKYKPDINARDRHQWTPLHSAASGTLENTRNEFLFNDANRSVFEGS